MEVIYFVVDCSIYIALGLIFVVDVVCLLMNENFASPVPIKRKDKSLTIM